MARKKNPSVALLYDNGYFQICPERAYYNNPGQRPGFKSITTIQVSLTLPAPIEFEGRGKGEGGYQ
jgi:hypothetical protein